VHAYGERVELEDDEEEDEMMLNPQKRADKRELDKRI